MRERENVTVMTYCGEKKGLQRKPKLKASKSTSWEKQQQWRVLYVEWVNRG